MPVITISRGSYSHGKAIAEMASEKMGYECIARDVLLEASEEFHIEEIKLLHSIQDAPSILDSFSYGRERYISYIQAALLKHLQKDNVVYHGFAGHFFVKDIPHVLKVRIIADLEDRVKLVMERDGIERNKALRFIKNIDKQRGKWSRHLYGIDTSDSSLYDLVLHVHRISIEDAVDIIIHTVNLARFQTTPESQSAMDDLVIAAEAKAALIALRPDIEVSARDAVLHVKTRATESREKRTVEEIRKTVAGIPEIKDLKIEVEPPTLFRDSV
jgi:cytidylate kinase